MRRGRAWLARAVAGGYERHLCVSIAVSVVLPIAVAMIAPTLAIRVIQAAFLTLFVMAPAIVLVSLVLPWVKGEQGLFQGMLRTFTVLQPGSTASSGGSLDDVPIATLALIGSNVAIHVGWVPLAGVLDYHDVSAATVVSAMFSHANASHLTGNMVMLWVMGSLLECRTGHLPFLGLYLLAGLGGTGALLLDHARTCPYPPGTAGTCGYLGASGAVAGVMGVFLVRLFSARVPILQSLYGVGGLLFGGRVQLPAPVVVFVFCLADLTAVERRASDGIAHSAHLGGYYSGLIAAYLLGYCRLGMRERNLIRASRQKTDDDLYSTREALDEALALDPTDVDAILVKARYLRAYSPREAAAAYRQAVGLLLSRRQPRRAAEVFRDLFALELVPVAPRDQLAITPHLVAIGERQVAANALQAVLQVPDLDDALRAPALAYYARLLVELGCHDAAQDVYTTLIARYPDHAGAQQGRAFLEKRESGM